VRDNEFLESGYRINYRGFLGVLSTLFKCHNETFNVWSHLLGKLLFLIIAIVVAFTYRDIGSAAEKGFN
jgi:adiponectin receptor